MLIALYLGSHLILMGAPRGWGSEPVLQDEDMEPHTGQVTFLESNGGRAGIPNQPTGP